MQSHIRTQGRVTAAGLPGVGKLGLERPYIIIGYTLGLLSS